MYVPDFMISRIVVLPGMESKPAPCARVAMIKNIMTVPMHDSRYGRMFCLFLLKFVFASFAYSRLFIMLTTCRKNCQGIGDLLIHLIAS